MKFIDNLDSKLDGGLISELKEKIAEFNNSFESKVEPKDGLYGTVERIKDNGTIERTVKLGDHHYQKEYYTGDNKLFKIREAIAGKTVTTDFDDLGNAYLKTETVHGKNVPESISRTLLPNTTVQKGSFTAQTDANGRLISTKITDVKINTSEKPNTTHFKKGNDAYLPTDDVGHPIAHNLGGPTGPENLVPQNQNVNRSAFKKVEGEVKKLVEQGNTVDYEVKINYKDSSGRPSSFEPKITSNGQDYDLPKDLTKIYNDPDITPLKKATTSIREGMDVAVKDGVKSGLLAAGITLAVSTVENVSAYVSGDITAEEMAYDIVTETAAAGVIEGASTIISSSISSAMENSSKAVIQKIGGSSLPAAVVSFAVTSYDCITDYAKGEIDGSEFVYELGDNAASVAGAIKGGAIGASIGTAVGGPVGSVVGGIVGGMVGAVVASEVYATAVEIGAAGAEIVAQRAEKIMQDTVEIFEKNIPEKLTEVKTAFNDFITEFKLPFQI